MAGTKVGAKKAAATNKAKHGRDFYREIGAIGGRASRTGGFAVDIPCKCAWVLGSHYKRQCSGTKGGRISRRRKAVEA